MVIPYTTENQAAAEEWINYVYDRANYAKLVAYTQYVPVLSDMTDELNKIDKNLAENPLINPPQATLDKLKHWPAMTDQQSREFTDAYQAVTRQVERMNVEAILTTIPHWRSTSSSHSSSGWKASAFRYRAKSPW